MSETGACKVRLFLLFYHLPTLTSLNLYACETSNFFEVNDLSPHFDNYFSLVSGVYKHSSDGDFLFLSEILKVTSLSCQGQSQIKLTLVPGQLKIGRPI